MVHLRQVLQPTVIQKSVAKSSLRKYWLKSKTVQLIARLFLLLTTAASSMQTFLTSETSKKRPASESGSLKTPIVWPYSWIAKMAYSQMEPNFSSE